MGTAKYFRRTKFASWRPYRCWCVAWLMLCQFPLPIAHSHNGLAHSNPQAWQAHVQVYHPEMCSAQDCNEIACSAHQPQDSDIHWHWILPGEFAFDGLGSQSNDRTVPVSSPFGLWGECSGASMGQVTSLILAHSQVESLILCLLAYHQGPGWFLKERSLSLTCEPRLARSTSWSSFTQSYIGVPLRDLIGVFLV